MKRSLTNEVLLGARAGYLASKLMDRVTTAYQDRQSEASKQREGGAPRGARRREGRGTAGPDPGPRPRPAASRTPRAEAPSRPGPLGWGHRRTPGRSRDESWAPDSWRAWGCGWSSTRGRK